METMHPVTDDVATFEVCRPWLVALAYRMLGDLGRAEDGVQEALRLALVLSSYVLWRRCSAEADAHLVALAGEPIDEPIVQHGPSVMSSMPEIQQAIIDVSRGKLGPVPE